jgi:hypothetical protein
MLEEGLDVVALKKLDLPKSSSDLKNWNTFAKVKKPKTLHNYWFDWEICRNAGLLQIDFGGLYSCRSFK